MDSWLTYLLRGERTDLLACSRPSSSNPSLSRAPSLGPNTTEPFAFRNSVFPASDDGLFEEISIVEVPNKTQTIESRSNDDDDAQSDPQPHHQSCTAWEWFAYLSSLTQFSAVAVPRNPSFRIEMIAVLRERFLCAKLVPGPNPHAVLCTYSRVNNSWQDVPTMQCEARNPISAAGAFLGGCLYLAGGYEGNVEPSTFLNSAERLNLKTWGWQTLTPMNKARAFARGLSHKGKFYVVGGATPKHSAEIYNPSSNTWQFLKSFVPKEADGFAVTSMYGRLMILTWSDLLGVKLWLWIEPVNGVLVGRWSMISYIPNVAVERVRFRQHGARLVQVGKEVWVLTGEISDRFCQVDGPSVWPVFPAPFFRPCDGHGVVPKGHIYAFSFQVGGRISWRQIPLYYANI